MFVDSFQCFKTSFCTKKEKKFCVLLLDMRSRVPSCSIRNKTCFIHNRNPSLLSHVQSEQHYACHVYFNLKDVANVLIVPYCHTSCHALCNIWAEFKTSELYQRFGQLDFNQMIFKQNGVIQMQIFTQIYCIFVSLCILHFRTKFLFN